MDPPSDPRAPVFRDEPLLAIVAYLEARLAAGDATIRLRALDPDRGRGRYAGEVVELDGARWRHRPYRVWVDLAERLGLRLCTPRTVDAHAVELRFERLDRGALLRAESAVTRERYAPESAFGRISKHEDPGFVLDLAEALDRVALGPAARVLDLGVNTGDELALLLHLCPQLGEAARFVGVDHSHGALAVARARFPGPRFIFVEADLGDLATAVPGTFDLVLSIGTLQSPGVDDRALLRLLVQQHLGPRGALVLGVPNCRYVDGEVEHGARMKNYAQPELGLVVKDLAFYRRYLQQHHRQVHLTGKDYLFLSAIPERPVAQPG